MKTILAVFIALTSLSANAETSRGDLEKCAAGLRRLAGIIMVSLHNKTPASGAQVMSVLQKVQNLGRFGLSVKGITPGKFADLTPDGQFVGVSTSDILLGASKTFRESDPTQAIDALMEIASSPAVFTVVCSFPAGPGSSVGN